MMLNITRSLLLLIFCTLDLIKGNKANDKDPFRSLGIPDINPKDLLEEVEKEVVKKQESTKNLPKLKSIDDLPTFLKNNNMNEEDAVKMLTRFLIQDDITLKKYGAIFDQTGFDGLPPEERIAPLGTEERLQQRARSAATIWFRNDNSQSSLEAYGADPVVTEIVPNWRVYKVLMVGRHGENTFLRVCIPLDESLDALCSSKDEECGYRTEYVEKEKLRNEDYIERIKNGNFFKKDNMINQVKLNPGEKIIGMDRGKEIVLDSSSLSNKLNQSGLFNPPMANQMNNVPPMANKMETYQNNLRGPSMMASSQQRFSQIEPRVGLQISQNYLPPMTQPMYPYGYGAQPSGGYMNTNMPIPNQPPVSSGNPMMNNSKTTQAYPQSNSASSFTEGNPMYNEILQMKSQINQLMQSLKDKDSQLQQFQMNKQSQTNSMQSQGNIQQQPNYNPNQGFMQYNPYPNSNPNFEATPHIN